MPEEQQKPASRSSLGLTDLDLWLQLANLRYWARAIRAGETLSNENKEVAQPAGHKLAKAGTARPSLPQADRKNRT